MADRISSEQQTARESQRGEGGSECVPEVVAVVHVELLGEFEHGAGGGLAPEGAPLIVLGPRPPHLGPLTLAPLPPAEPRVRRVRRHPLPAHAAPDRGQHLSINCMSFRHVLRPGCEGSLKL